MVRTVLGDILPSKLGHCQPHEHIIVRPAPATESNPSLLIDDEAKSLCELVDYRQAGGGSIIDCQPGGAGRDADALMRLSEKSGVHIVTVTGYHLPIFYPNDHFVFTAGEEALFEHFLAELTQGITGQGRQPPLCAGAVKAAIDESGAVGHSKLLLFAAAKAAASAAVPLILHTERGIGAVEAVSLCEHAGLSPEKILVCHVDRQAGDYGIHEAIAATGAMLEYDTVCRPKYHGDISEGKLIAHMLGKGYQRQLLLSLDTTRARLKSYGGDIGLSYLLETFLPFLREFGLSQEDIEALTRINPARIFEP